MVTRVITKQLIGVEDLLLGTGTVNQTRASGTVPIKKIDSKSLIHSGTETLDTKLGKKAEVVNTIAAMKSIANETSALVLGYLTPGDGGGGLFYLDTADTSSVDDGNIVFTPVDPNRGRWKRASTENTASSDIGDISYTIPEVYEAIQLFSTTLTANRTVTLPSANLFEGKHVTILRTDIALFTMTLGSVFTIPSGISASVTLTYTNSAWLVTDYTELASAIGAGLIEEKVYTADAVWSKPSGCTRIEVIRTGGGGGGGAAMTNTASDTALAGGGGGGTVVESTFLGTTIPISANIVIGIGGIGSADPNVNGASGLASTFGSITTSGNGGSGGGSTQDGFGLLVGSTAGITRGRTGGRSTPASVVNFNGTVWIYPSSGGNSIGSGAAAVSTTGSATPANANANSGGGGSGGAITGSAGTSNGGNGGSGLVIVRSYIK